MSGDDTSTDFVKKACAKISNNPEEVSTCELDLQRLMDTSKEFQTLRKSLAEKYDKPPEDIDKAIKEAILECAPCQKKQQETATDEKQATPEKAET